jgi:flagellar hook-length control protein FliK
MPASSQVRGSRTPVEGSRPAGSQGSGESRNFDDVLSDVHAAKNDKASSGSQTSKPDDKSDPESASSEASQAQATVVVVAPVPVAVLDTAPQAANRSAARARAAAGHDDRNHHDDPAISESALADAVRPARSPTPPAVLVPVAAESQRQPGPAQNHHDGADGNVTAAVVGRLAIGTEAVGKPVARTARAFVPGQAGDQNVPQAAGKEGDAAATGDRFAQHVDLPQDHGNVPEAAPTGAQASSNTASSVQPGTTRSEQTVPGPASTQDAAVLSALKAQTPVPSAVPSATDQAQAASAAASVTTIAPQPAVRDAATQASSTAARRATSRVAAQAVLDKVVRQDGAAKEAATAPASAAVAAAGGTARVALISGSPSPESARQAGKPTVARAPVGDTISIAATLASSNADTAAGERRSSGQGSGGQEAAPQAKQLLVSAAGTGVVVTSPELRQAFDRMLTSVAMARPSLDGSSGAAVTDQIVRGMQLQMKGNVGEARITLAPEHLGEVVVEMRVEKDGVVATLRADTPAVRGWLATHQDDLRAGLADVGLRLDDLQVSERDSQRGRQQPPAEQQPQTPRRARRTSTGELPRFEVEA